VEPSLVVKVFPEQPVVEKTGGQQHLNFEFRLESVGGPVKLLNMLVRTHDRSGALSRMRQLVPQNYQANFSDVALFQGNQFLGSEVFDVDAAIPAGGRVLFFNPWHSFGAEEPLTTLTYIFYYVDERGRVSTTHIDVRPQEARAWVPLRLPMAGRWLVIEGHDYETHHRRIFSPTNAHRYASDFVALHPDDVVYHGDGTHLTDYASFGAEVYASGAGTVVASEGSLVDNPVGARDEQQPLGNHVFIDHGAGIVSVLAHLMRGSVAVRMGDKVAAGQPVAKVGNSGGSDLPHLHYHLQRGTDANVARAEGLVSLFGRYKRMVGKQEILVELGSPATGDVLQGELPNAGSQLSQTTGEAGSIKGKSPKSVTPVQNP
jgi:hypothetical protein